MGAIDPACAFDNRSGQHARFAEQLQSNASTDDIHDRVHRADLVEMDLFGRDIVNAAFSDSDPLEYSDRPLLDPIREAALSDKLFYFGKVPAMVLFMLVMRTMLMMLVRVGMFVVFVVLFMLMFRFVRMMLPRRMVSAIVIVFFVRHMDLELHP